MGKDAKMLSAIARFLAHPPSSCVHASSWQLSGGTVTQVVESPSSTDLTEPGCAMPTGAVMVQQRGAFRVHHAGRRFVRHRGIEGSEATRTQYRRRVTCSEEETSLVLQEFAVRPAMPCGVPLKACCRTRGGR